MAVAAASLDESSSLLSILVYRSVRSASRVFPVFNGLSRNSFHLEAAASESTDTSAEFCAPDDGFLQTVPPLPPPDPGPPEPPLLVSEELTLDREREIDLACDERDLLSVCSSSALPR